MCRYAVGHNQGGESTRHELNTTRELTASQGRPREHLEHLSRLMTWSQTELTVTPPKRGCHLITDSIRGAVGAPLREYSVGIANVFVKHTSCSLTINENAGVLLSEPLRELCRWE